MNNNIFNQLFNHGENQNLTDKYLINNPEINNKIDSLLWSYNEIGDVIPQYIGKLGSGHFFPFSESHFELNCAFQLIRLSFYKHSFIALRNAFELGLLSIFWDRDDNAEEVIQNWHKSEQNTPFKRQIIEGIKKIDNINEFNTHFDIFDRIENIYGTLSDYTHTKGVLFSSNKLNRANFTRFNENALLSWTKEFEKVVKLLLTVHILKYPISIQDTPIEEKFGINGPFGGFLDTYQSNQLKSVLNSDEVKVLQRISDNDENAKLQADWVNSHENITEEELKEQLSEFNKFVKMQSGNDKKEE